MRHDIYKWQVNCLESLKVYYINFDQLYPYLFHEKIIWIICIPIIRNVLARSSKGLFCLPAN